MRRTATSKEAREAIKLRTVIAAFLLIIVGLVLLWAEPSIGEGGASTFIQTFAALVLVSGLISLLYEVLLRRAFLREAMDLSGLSRDLDYGGVTAVYGGFREVDWQALLKDACSLDLFVAYARTWRNRHEPELRELVARRNSTLRVVLPNPDHGPTIEELARRFNNEPKKVEEKVRDAIAFFSDVIKAGNGPGGIWLADFPICESLYRVDGYRIIALQSHHQGKSDVPTIFSHTDGYVVRFVDRELDRIFDGGNVQAHPLTI